MTKKAYVAKTPIQHSGENYAPGDPIDLDDKTEAPQLLAVGAIEAAPEAKKSGTSK